MRWDSLGEFLALAGSLDHVADKYDNVRARILGVALDVATTEYLLQDKSPSRKVNELDNRGTHYYVALFWAQAIAAQTDDAELAAIFGNVAETLAANEATIIDELNAAQGSPMDIGGYFQPDDEVASKWMRPSATLNGILASI